MQEEVEARDRDNCMRQADNLLPDLSIARVRKLFINSSGFHLESVFPSRLSHATVLTFATFCKNSFQLKTNWNQLT